MSDFRLEVAAQRALVPHSGDMCQGGLQASVQGSEGSVTLLLTPWPWRWSQLRQGRGQGLGRGVPVSHDMAPTNHNEKSQPECLRWQPQQAPLSKPRIPHIQHTRAHTDRLYRHRHRQGQPTRIAEVSQGETKGRGMRAHSQRPHGVRQLCALPNKDSTAREKCCMPEGGREGGREGGLGLGDASPSL